MKFECKVCGFIYEGEETPEVCEVCGEGKEAFDKIEG